MPGDTTTSSVGSSCAPADCKINESLPEVALCRITHADIAQWTLKVLQYYEMPICFLALESANGMYLKGRHGIETKFVSFPTMCRHEELRELPVIVCDVRQHCQYRFDLLVEGPPKARFYVGVPLLLPGHRCIGTLCLMSPKPKEFFSLRKCDFMMECSREIAMHLCNKVHSFLCQTVDSLGSLGASPTTESLVSAQAIQTLDSLADVSADSNRNLDRQLTKESLASIDEIEEGEEEKNVQRPDSGAASTEQLANEWPPVYLSNASSV